MQQLVACLNAGGLTAVIYTDALQTVIMVIGAFVLMFIGIDPFFMKIYNYMNYSWVTTVIAFKKNFPLQHLTKLDGMRVCWFSMRALYLLSRFPTPLVIFHGLMPFISSEIQ